MVDTLVDAPDLGGNLDQLEKELASATLARSGSGPSQKVVKNAQQETPADDDVPEKYRGKSLKDIIAMHQNAESRLGVMANDLGTQRKLTDRLLDLKRETDLGNNTSPQKVQVKSDELLENPTETLDRYIAPREQANQQRLEQLERQIAAQAFAAQHPDYQSYVDDDGFQTWVKSSPIRARVAAAAAAGDWTSASDLLTEYKAEKAARSQKVDDDEGEVTEQPDKLSAARKVSLETSSQSSAGAKKGGKIYRRADLMRLRVEKPEAYYAEDLQAEILRAYDEGRVK